MVCEKFKKEGYFLYDSFICIDCEKEIIKTETSDPVYRFYLRQLKKINSKKILY
ncbi:MAG: carnitine--CoA ligase [Caldibacillus debilis]|uniref:Carnitine--CoA ligase n=2 Tax=Caldibacillus debilis TaxID=301148 RepID=A0A3E0K837_9BACI|nr:MAG: carnitine--CoA ligase [Caldibacillus debilis]REJ23320.1 MAG: carnitine--CoA ligase [Caldibacillus debilis]REJ31389.1 MAG: carnitine--CoA ligase [Caldibacillus debilis]